MTSPERDPDSPNGPAHLQHPRFARAYARAVEGMDGRGAAAHRRELLQRLSGSVVEIGAGNGANFAHYPSTVTSVLAIEPDDHLRPLAQQQAQVAPVPVRVVTGTAETIPAPDASADAVVVSLVLCSVPDQAAALAEGRRVLKSGGILAFYEHVRSNSAVLAAAQDLLTPLWQRAAGGCHPNRDTLRAITEAGFEVQDNRRFDFSVQPLVPATAHILGHAVSPGAGSRTDSTGDPSLRIDKRA
ncbi:methyltransferase domain-containing protein [Arthrobacter sp. JZ12]|uniref:class I SAM-dependent methyltransferase n=1 Tax=Arthrobacter sp. JZ12 TaxID=2654190 RepID=UPI002B488AEA|nr:class I SAM-dependent methyltransferase [Arthrobacter sp. JZ12]WRH24158.1 methyltransferase domain-containing protein [Arthrobacter sp. JZ12]